MRPAPSSAALSLFGDPPAAIAPGHTTSAVPETVLAALRRATIDTTGLDATVDLPMVAPDVYRAAKEILAYCGFAWDRHRKTHVGRATDVYALEEVVTTGRHFDSKHELEFFATSDSGAKILAGLAAGNLWQDEPRILEPSAGDGALVAALLTAVPHANVTAIEVDARRAAVLRRRFAGQTAVRVIEGDFLEFAETGWDAVVLNPPFALALEHIRHAYELVRYGAEILGLASLNRQIDADLADWLNDRDAWTEETEKTTFRDTTVRASFFGFRCEPSYCDRLRAVLKEHHPQLLVHVRTLQRVSRDLHRLFTDECNGVIDDRNGAYESRLNALLATGQDILDPVGVRMLISTDPRSGHGLKLVLPAGITNDFGQTGIIVPVARESAGSIAIAPREADPAAVTLPFAA